MKLSGIYQIQSQIKPERIYIGSAVNLRTRKNGHFCMLRKNEHHSIVLQNHFNKYGINDLIYSILEICEIENLLVREQYFIDELHPYFNVRKIAESNYGVRRSKETIEKLAALHRGKKLSEEHKLKCSLSLKGRIVSEETRKKIGLANSKSLKGNIPWMKGKHHSSESKRKMSLALKGRISNNKGKPSPFKGIKGRYSQETLYKMSVSAKNRKIKRVA
jgi:group I intron endonuclease